jgi:transcription elongation factor GreA-like protein
MIIARASSNGYSRTPVYVQKILKKFNMDKAYPATTRIIVCALEKDKDPFKSREEREEVLRQEYSYLSVIGALMYLANNTGPNIAFVMNCLTRHSATPTMHHWSGIKNILQYLVGTIDL